MPTRLQPFHIFKQEVTRLNLLYWSSSYCYAKTRAVLDMLASTGHGAADPRVDAVWPSKVNGEAKHTTIGLADFRKTLDANAEALRSTAVLHLCSAFEVGICNYFALCALYEPKTLSRAPKHRAVPACLASRIEFEAAKRWAVGQSNCLKKNYSIRLSHFEKVFGINFALGALPSRLDGHYRKRHLVAHDQGLARADAPDLSAADVLASRLSLSEAEWKKCIEDFLLALKAIDDAVQGGVVKDRGLPLAVYHALPKMKPCTVGALRHAINTSRNLNESYASVEAAVRSMGHKVAPQRSAKMRLIT